MGGGHRAGRQAARGKPRQGQQQQLSKTNVCALPAGMWTAVTGPDGKRHGNGYDKDADVYMHDPMEDPLPNAPSMKMYCTYGVDKPVER